MTAASRVVGVAVMNVLRSHPQGSEHLTLGLDRLFIEKIFDPRSHAPRQESVRLAVSWFFFSLPFAGGYATRSVERVPTRSVGTRTVTQCHCSAQKPLHRRQGQNNGEDPPVVPQLRLLRRQIQTSRSIGNQVQQAGQFSRTVRLLPPVSSANFLSTSRRTSSSSFSRDIASIWKFGVLKSFSLAFWGRTRKSPPRSGM